MEEDIKKKINQVEDYLCDVGLDLEYARDELNRLYDTLEEKSNNGIKDINNFKRELKRDGLYNQKLEGIRLSQTLWGIYFILSDNVKTLIPKETRTVGRIDWILAAIGVVIPSVMTFIMNSLK